MSTAKDILCRCQYLIKRAEGSDSRRLLSVEKSLKSAMDALEYFRNSQEPWNQDVVDNLKKSVEVVAISMEEMLAYEQGCLDCMEIAEKRAHYKDLRRKVHEIQREVGVNGQESETWLVMSGYVNELANAADCLLLDEQDSCQIIEGIVEQEVNKYYVDKEFA